MLNGRVPDKERIKRSNNDEKLWSMMALGIRFFSFHITYSFSFFKENGLYLLRKTKYSSMFCNKLHANEPMYKKLKRFKIQICMNIK